MASNPTDVAEGKDAEKPAHEIERGPRSAEQSPLPDIDGKRKRESDDVGDGPKPKLLGTDQHLSPRFESNVNSNEQSGTVASGADDSEPLAEHSAAKSATAALCDVCGTHPFKYKCPRCFCRSCSLVCSKEHKVQSSCTGQRNKTEFVPMSKYTPNHMSSDYVFLEEAYRIADNATRDIHRIKSEMKPHQMRQQLLLRQCRWLGIRIRFMPAGMKRHELNQSIFIQKFKFISWTIEWKFAELGLTKVDHRVKDNTSLSDALSKHIDEHEGNAAERHELKRYCDAGLSNLFVYMEVPDKQANERALWKLDMTRSIRDNLRGKSIVEFPTIVVYAEEPADITIVQEHNVPSSDIIIDRGANEVTYVDEVPDAERDRGSLVDVPQDTPRGDDDTKVQAVSESSTKLDGPVDLELIARALNEDLGPS
ncbi:hypothetical protein BC832DRAFT_565807 [Gaertneriomyces semiglobifer]|nr:hypothetical protein BC832DRAFT_565807 [Gaertneriomyces semiglobifer]